MENLKFKKATQVSCFFLHRNLGVLNYTKLLKLMYLADRESLSLYGYTITNDNAVSMDNGPVLSGVYDLIKGIEFKADQEYWNQFIKKTSNYEVELKEMTELDELSKKEITILKDIDNKFKGYDEWEMVRYCHRNLAEWVNPKGSSLPIKLEDILTALEKKEDEIKEIIKENNFYRFVNNILN